MIPIVEEYLSLINAGMQVLEIGCGSWDWIKRQCEQVGACYEGIDVQPEYFGKRVIATRIENLQHLSFEDERFDLVIGNQTMEHWAENGCTVLWGLYQCFRVCKAGGRVLMNVPIHFHGTRAFMLGEIDALRELFARFSSTVRLEEWGVPSDPLPPLFPHGGYWPLRRKPAYVLAVQAAKDRPMPARVGNRGASSGRMAQLLNYPFSYNVYRVLRKLGLGRSPR
ncbi:MAG: class I SAM-dependent methyltransferase [Pirellulales bacterium]